MTYIKTAKSVLSKRRKPHVIFNIPDIEANLVGQWFDLNKINKIMLN